MKNRNLELTVDGKDPVVRERVVKLLKKYNAALGFNSDQNVFEVDLEVQFASVQEKDRFVKSYLTSKVRTAMHNKHRTILEERSKDQDNHYASNSHAIQQLIREKQLINEAAIREQQHMSIMQPSLMTSDPYVSKNSEPQFKIYARPCESDSKKEQQEKSETSKAVSSHKSSHMSSHVSSQKQLEDTGIDYPLLDYKLEITINNIFRMLSTHKYSSAQSRHSNSIKIVDQPGDQDIMTYRRTPQQGHVEMSPSTIQPASTERDHLSVIRDINSEIDKFEQQSLDLNRYTVQSVIEEENPSELSVESQADIKRKRQHFQFLQNRMSMPKLTKQKKVYPLPFDENRFRQFIQIEKTRIDILFEQTKMKVKGPPEKSKSRLKTPGLDLWRQHLTDPRSALHDPSEIFSKKFYEAFETRILAENKMLSSGQLVNYFKFLLQNARKMYVDFVQSTKC